MAETAKEYLNDGDNSLLHDLELSTYLTFHASISVDLTAPDRTFDRNIVGITLNDADKVYAVTGCRRLEEYLVRITLNDSAFSSLLYRSLGGRTQKAVTLVT